MNDCPIGNVFSYITLVEVKNCQVYNFFLTRQLGLFFLNDWRALSFRTSRIQNETEVLSTNRSSGMGDI